VGQIASLRPEQGQRVSALALGIPGRPQGISVVTEASPHAVNHCALMPLEVGALDDLAGALAGSVARVLFSGRTDALTTFRGLECWIA